MLNNMSNTPEAIVQHIRESITEELGISMAKMILDMQPKSDDETTRLRQQLDIAITGMNQTIEENLHLADGDNCTLIKLKQALAQIRELEKRR